MGTTGFKWPTTVQSMDTTSVILRSIAEIGTNLGVTPGFRALLMLITRETQIKTVKTTYSGSIPIPSGMHLHLPEGLGGT